MRILVGFDGNFAEWRAVPRADSDTPALPLAYAFGQAFVRRGHELIGLCGKPGALPAGTDTAPFSRVFPHNRLGEALDACDAALLWSRNGIRASLHPRSLLRRRTPVVLASYVWQSAQPQSRKVRLLETVTRVASRFCRGVVLMTGEQCDAARETLGRRARVVPFTCGVDLQFYERTTDPTSLPGDLRAMLDRIAQAPFVIVAGDQLRFDDDAMALVRDHGFRLVRVVQEVATAERYRRWIEDYQIGDRCFILNRIPYPALRWLLQRASAYAGMVDSSWQPAGWTVACEALASGTPAVLYEGLAARELARLGAGSLLETVAPGDVPALASQLGALCTHPPPPGERDAALAALRAALDIERCGEAFAENVETLISQSIA